jgi:hypothetical protein
MEVAVEGYREHTQALRWGLAGLFMMCTGVVGVRFAIRSLGHLFNDSSQERLVLAHGLGLVVIGLAAILLTLWGISWQVASFMAAFDQWKQTHDAPSRAKAHTK